VRDAEYRPQAPVELDDQRIDVTHDMTTGVSGSDHTALTRPSADLRGRKKTGAEAPV
jgi:hypothetical protein